MAEFKNILALIGEVVPNPHDRSLKEILSLNEKKMDELLAHVLKPKDSQNPDQPAGPLAEEAGASEGQAESYFVTQDLQKMMADEKEERKQEELNHSRLHYLKFMIAFRQKEHIEMLNLTRFQQIVSVEGLKIILSKSRFVNYTIQEKQTNTLLGLQGYYLKNFIYFHMKADMKFKATIDSSTIDMDNPYTRNTIREENRKDVNLSEKYIKHLNVESLCLALLDRFFPEIAGIWADHSHFMPYYAIEFIKMCFEFGFISPPVAKKILLSLAKKTVNLIKLEEGWLERLNEVKLLSDMIKANNITTLFAKCRENMAFLLLQIIVLLCDDAFIRDFPQIVASKLAHKQELKEEGTIDLLGDSLKESFCFFDKEVNDSLLYITMNYLSNTVYISLQKGMNPESRMAVERVFLFVTTTNRDAFLNSLKQVKASDLKYFNKEDVVAEKLRKMADDFGNTMRKLLQLISMGVFDRQKGIMSKKYEPDREFNDFLKDFVPKDNPTLKLILDRILSFIEDHLQTEDFSVALVKESIPLALIALVDYITEYFGPEVRVVNRQIFNKLAALCRNNNYCKAQLFKGDALFHLRKLLNKPDKDAFLFINSLCNEEDNIAFFLGRELFSELMMILEKYNKTIVSEVFGDKSVLDKFAEKFESGSVTGREAFKFQESCAIFILMNKIVANIFQKEFLNEREKLQSALMAQEVLYHDVCKNYLPKLLELLSDESLKSSSEPIINKSIFADVIGAQMVQKLEEIETSMTESQRKIVILNVCFSVLKAFNMVCDDSYSSIVYKVTQAIAGKTAEDPVPKEAKVELKDDDDTDAEAEDQRYKAKGVPTTIYDYLCLPFKARKRQIEPFSLETEFVTFIRLFTVYPGEHCMIETRFESRAKEEKMNRTLLRRCIRKVSYMASTKEDQDEAQYYLLEGLFPLMYRILKGIRNLSNFDKQQSVSYNLEQIKYIMLKLNSHIKNFNNILGHQVFEEDEFTVNTKANDKAERPIKRRKPSLLGGDKAGADTKGEKKSDSSNTKQKKLIDACDYVIEFIAVYYEETAENKPNLLRRFKDGLDISKEKFLEMIYAAKFDENSDLPIIKLKKQVLNSYIKTYQTYKEDYFEREEEPNLMSYFDRNDQNLKGVFSSCIDRLLNRSKMERRASHSKSLAVDFAISRFWLNPPCYAYINMLQRLLTKSKHARKIFYQYLQEDIAEQNFEKKSLDEGTYEDGGNLGGVNQLARPRNNLISILVRIHTDLLIFLNSNASLTPLWWICHQIYEMINDFIQNLCEGNFEEFKTYLSTFSPVFKDEGWQLLQGKTVMEVLVKEFVYLQGACRISKNKDPEMVHTDFIEKMNPLLTPLLNVINEAITGPCQQNQVYLMAAQPEGLINIAMRIIDDFDCDYNDLADSALTLLLSLCEGFDSSILKALASKTPSSILVDRIHRLSKKLYIKELIEYGKFKPMAQDKMLRVVEAENKAQPGAASTAPQTSSDSKTAPTASGHLMTAELEKENQIKLGKKLIEDCLDKQDVKNSKYIITEEMESMVDIENWKHLYDIYMGKPEFSDSRQFHYIFKIMILWQNFRKVEDNKNHISRYDDAKYESRLYFKKTNLFGFEEGNEKVDEKRKNTKQVKKEVPPEFCCIFYFISEMIMTEIEVLNPKGESVAVYFPKAPQCYMLSEQAKKAYRDECEITDSNTKMLALMRNFKMFNILMESDLQTWRKIGFLFKGLSSDAFKGYTFFCWLFGVVINVIMAGSIIMDSEGKTFMYRTSKHEQVMRILSYILVAISALFLVVWIIFKYRQTYLTRFEDFLFDHPGVSRNSFGVKLRVAVFSSFIQQAFPMNYMLHIIFTILGMEVTIFAMALNLLLIVNISKTTKFVLTSITLHWDQLVQTLILAFFVIYAYSMVIGSTLREQINPDLNTPCDTLVECFFFTINLGLRNGGGIAESLSDVKKDLKFGVRSVFDVTFFLLINVISLNIIFGIIIDTFSQLRDDQNARGRLNSP